MVPDEIRLVKVSDDTYRVYGLTNRLRPPIGAMLNEQQIQEMLLESRKMDWPLRIKIT